jgi:hypothetical protein
MRRARKPLIGNPARGPLDGPTHDDRTLIVAFRSPGAVKSAAASLELGETPAQDAIARLREYVARNEAAALTPLCPRRAAEKFMESAAGLPVERWELALPRLPDDLALHHLRLASPQDAAALQAVHGDEIAYVEHPAILYAPPPPPPSAWRLADHQWALARCGFEQVWQDLDGADHLAPIAVIDDGGDMRHRDLEGRIARYVPPGQGTPSRSVHACAVAGVIAALRGNADEKGMAGCCSAQVHLFNAWADDFDVKAFYAALDDVIEGDTRVVNMSLTTTVGDKTLKDRIQKCVAKGKVVVAAMGDFALKGSPKLYPAAYDGVIAVGGTDRSDRRFALSSTGRHIWISAPGEDIWTIYDRRRCQVQTGTSFATAMVSAAAWLALRKRSELTLLQVKALLAQSVGPKPTGTGTGFEEIGHGRLDMVKLKKMLNTV